MEKTASVKKSIRSRLFSTSHRVIARQYFFLSLAAVLLGTALSLLMRFHLIYPLTPVGGDVMAPEYYLSLLTLHGTLMVFFVLTLAPFNAFGNLVLPEQLGAPAHGLSAVEYAFLLDHGRVLFATGRVVSGGGRRTAVRLDRLSAAQRRRGHRRAGRRARPDALVLQHRAFFHRVPDNGHQHDRDRDGRARPRHDSHAHAPNLLELVRDRDPEPAGVLRTVRGAASDSARPPRRHQLLHPGRAVGQRSDHPAQRRLSPALAAPVLVFRASRGLHRDPAGHGNRFAPDLQLLAQTGVRLSRHGVGDDLDRVPRPARLGTPHVHQRTEPVLGHRVFAADDGDRRAIRGEDVQLDRDRLGRGVAPHNRRCCSRSASYRSS